MSAADKPPPSDPFAVSFSIDREKFFCMAKIRRRQFDGDSIVLGLELSFARHRPLLTQVYLRNLLPNLVSRHQISPDEVTDLFRSTGYLKHRPGMSPTSRWLSLDEPTLSRDLVYADADGHPVGHVSITRAYSNTWLGHQIAMRRDHAESADARESLYFGFTMIPTLLDGDDTYLLGYYSPEQPWHKVFFGEFVDCVNDSHATCIRNWDRLATKQENLIDSIGKDTGIEVSPMRSGEECLITNIARSHLPGLLGNAMDIEPAALRSDALHSAYKDTVYQRKRQVLVLREQGQVTACAIIESSSPELSIFNMLNVAQIFHSTTNASESGRYLLLEEVVQFYRRHDISDPTILAPQGSFPVLPGWTCIETLACIVWTAGALRAYESYLRLRFKWLKRESKATTSYSPQRRWQYMNDGAN